MFCREDDSINDDIFINEAETSDEEEPVEKLPNKQQKAKPPVKRQPWDKVEMEEIYQYFQEYLDMGICPRQAAVETAKKKSRKAGGKI